MSSKTLLSIALLGAWAAVAAAQVVPPPAEPQIGSSNPVSAEPDVRRPPTKPCTVTLFQNLAFEDYTPATFSYAPPSGCPGPWAKVVFTADFTVTAGRQYDRTAAFYLDHANIYYGTTAEPRQALSPSWHVERDVTDLSAIFKSDQTGEANIGNFVGVYSGVNYNGIIYATAALQFYPTSPFSPAPRTPDVVVPVNGTGGDAGTLNTTADQITQTLDLPRNVEKVYLDVIAQSQSNDEFWYFCVPNNETSNLESCGNTAFRETEISIDGKPAGVAPVYPWIYTGGIDPYLWEPLPGVQTLDFKPYRVDLTPFAGVLANGQSHVVGVSVYNADSYFLATANLLAFTDHGRAEVRGGILENTLSDAPSPTVKNNISTLAGPEYKGTITVTSTRDFRIKGYVETSHGRVETTVEQDVAFENRQYFDVDADLDEQNVKQTSTVHSRTTTRDGVLFLETDRDFSYPLTIDFSYVINSDGSFSQATAVKQGDTVSQVDKLEGINVFSADSKERVDTHDTLSFDASGNLVSANGGATASYVAKDSLGVCYSRKLTASQRELTSVKDQAACHE